VIFVLAALVVVLLAFHAHQAEQWSRERRRLIAAALQPTPQAAAATLTALDLPKRSNDEPPKRHPVAIGEDV